MSDKGQLNAVDVLAAVVDGLKAGRGIVVACVKCGAEVPPTNEGLYAHRATCVLDTEGQKEAEK